jgi:anaerobic selenocysteine-containing dehydrogenase
MATQDKEPMRSGISRRTFLKASGAVAAAGAAGLDFALSTPNAYAAPVASTYRTTCPYCSAQCGQIVAVDANGNVLDIYGDVDSPTNNGGLCAKGAASYQLVTNARRLGVSSNIQGKDNLGVLNGRIKAAGGTTSVAGFTGPVPATAAKVAWKRTGNGPWVETTLDTALTDIATGLVAQRNAGGSTPSPDNYHNSKNVMFFGSSHCNNESNYLYRKMIATFGTSNIEHQARI